MRSIETDGYRRAGLIFGVALVLAGAWTAWFTLARVAVIEVAETARLEVDESAYSLEATVAGRVTVSRLALGQEVHAGEALVELDSEAFRLSVNQERANQAAFAPQIVALSQQIEAEERALEEQRAVTRVKVDESRARSHEAEVAAELASGEMQRTGRLRAEGLASESEAQKAKADAEQKRSVAEGGRLATDRIGAEQRAAEVERRAKLAGLRKDLALLEGQKASSLGTLERLEHDIERRTIRAPIGGHVGEIAPIRVGGVVKEGAVLGAIIPRGHIRIVAEFTPAAAVGRVRPGQSAKMRLDGFPWTQYGMLDATVRRVAGEPRSGKIRVELDVNAAERSRIPLEHGLPGILEVEIERVPPAAIVLRAAGQGSRAPAPALERKRDDGDSR